MVFALGMHCCVVSRMKAWTQIDDVDEKDGGTADGLRWHLQEGSSRQTRISGDAVRTRAGGRRRSWAAVSGSRGNSKKSQTYGQRSPSLKIKH